MKSIVLLSGGMDSCVSTAIALQESNEVALLHITYGHRTQKRELKSFYDISEYYKIKEKLVVNIDYLSKIGGSALTDLKIDVPISKLSAENEIPATYVPFRNGNLLSISASWAEVIKAERIYIGAVEEDSSGYPDTRSQFFKDFEKAINSGTKPETKISIITPLIKLNKSEIVLKGIKLNAPLHLTWSCYKNEDYACGKCESCILRLKGFNKAGTIDKIAYK